MEEVTYIKCTSKNKARDLSLKDLHKLIYDILNWIHQKGIDLNHDFYIVFGKQYRTENAYTGQQHNIFI